MQSKENQVHSDKWFDKAMQRALVKTFVRVYQATGQKLIVYIALGSMLYLAYGANQQQMKDGTAADTPHNFFDNPSHFCYHPTHNQILSCFGKQILSREAEGPAR